MATNNAVNVGLAGSTGTGNFVGANTPTLITPVLGVATATSLVFSPTTSGIIGTTTNDNAATGKVGEFVSSTVSSGAPVSLVTGTSKTVTSISLTAGDWDVSGFIGTVLGAGTIVSAMVSGLSLTNNVLGGEFANEIAYNVLTANNAPTLSAPLTRFSLSATTTVYLVSVVVFSVSTANAFGLLSARRMR